MDLVTSFAFLLQEFAVVMNTKTLANFTTLTAGWIFAHRHTITGMIVAAGVAGAAGLLVYLLVLLLLRSPELGAIPELIRPRLGRQGNP